MAFFALNMLNMALELAKHNPVYEDIASKFFEHFLFISQYVFPCLSKPFGTDILVLPGP